MSSALNITSSNIVSYGSGLAKYSYVNGNTTYVASQYAMTPDSDWYKIFTRPQFLRSIEIVPGYVPDTTRTNSDNSYYPICDYPDNDANIWPDNWAPSTKPNKTATFA